MKRTKAAGRWLAVARRYMTTEAYLALITKAQDVAKARGATRLGKRHCEIALFKLDQEGD